MKKMALLFVLMPVWLHCFKMPWLRREQEQKAPASKVVVLKISDPIKFDEVSASLFAAAKQPDITGVLLVINSYGGSMSDFSVLHDMIKKLASIKPTICLVTGAAYSAGYLLASATNFIFAHSLSGIGSIGVYRSVDRYKNVRIKEGNIEGDCKSEIFYAGEQKVINNPYAQELTDVQKSFLYAQLAKLYDVFISMVADNRHLDKNMAKEWAEGKAFEAPDALKLGLIDEIGTIFDAQDKIKQFIVKRNTDICADDIEFVYERDSSCASTAK